MRAGPLSGCFTAPAQEADAAVGNGSMFEILNFQMPRKIWMELRHPTRLLPFFFVALWLAKYQGRSRTTKSTLPTRSPAFSQNNSWKIVLCCAASVTFSAGCHQNRVVKKSLPSVKVLSPEFKVSLNQSDYLFDRQQVAGMIHDRGKVANFVKNDTDVYEWLVRQFAGEAAGQHIYWDPAPPECSLDCLSSSAMPGASRVGAVRVRAFYETGVKKGQKLSLDDFWSYTIFEIYNLSNHENFLENYQAAIDGKAGREEWITGQARIEFSSIQKTRRFFKEMWLPCVSRQGLRVNEYSWFMDEPSDYEGWISQFKDRKGYPFGPYGLQYDQMISPFVKR